ncbi:MAG TPA: Fic family protein [Polyangia bacterium]
MAWYHSYIMQLIDLADFLLVAEAVTDIESRTLKNIARIPEAESALAAPYASFEGIDFYPEPETKAAILCSRLVRNHPLPDGNKRVAFLLMLEHFERAGLTWTEPDGGQKEIAYVIEALAGSEIAEDAFIEWVHARAAP